jgi:hypothetical protein
MCAGEFTENLRCSRFNRIYGDKILAQFNISLVPPEEVIWNEKLLKGEI